MKHLKIKKKVLLMLSSVFFSLCAFADDNVTLQIFDKTGGDPMEIPVNSVRKLTFQDAAFVVEFNDISIKNLLLYYDDVSSMKFSDTPTGIDTVNPDGNNAGQIIYNGSTIQFVGFADNVTAMLYDIAGRPVMKFSIVGDAYLNAESLAPGIYVVRVNNKSLKFNKL